jgi:hypothetical protein
LDFLGFIRPNQGFSKGYERKNKKKSTRVSSCVQNVSGLSYGVRPIGSPAQRLETRGAISESVLSDPNGLRRHFRIADSRNVRRATPPLISLPCALGLASTRRKNRQKAKGFLSPSETSGFATLVVSL